MSYILDALRKVERERQRTHTPFLEELLATGTTPRARLWPWLIVGALLANAVALAVLFVPRGPRLEPARVSPPVVTTARHPTVGAASSAQEERSSPRPPEATEAPAKRPVEKEAAPAQGPTKASVSKPPPRAITTARNIPAREGTPGAAPPGEEDRKGSGRPGRERLQKAVAELKLKMLLYSESAPDRLALINGRKYLEGQKIDNTLLIEAITPTGVVLSYEGERYLLTP
jgi:general secretion pathway protein B